MSEPMGLKRDRQTEENSAWREERPLRFSVEKINRICTAKGSCADFRDINEQYGNKEL